MAYRFAFLVYILKQLFTLVSVVTGGDLTSREAAR